MEVRFNVGDRAFIQNPEGVLTDSTVREVLEDGSISVDATMRTFNVMQVTPQYPESPDRHYIRLAGDGKYYRLLPGSDKVIVKAYQRQQALASIDELRRRLGEVKPFHFQVSGEPFTASFVREYAKLGDLIREADGMVVFKGSDVEKQNKLIDIMFAIGMMFRDQHEWLGQQNYEQVAAYIARQLAGCGFYTHPCGVSWGILCEAPIEEPSRGIELVSAGRPE